MRKVESTLTILFVFLQGEDLSKIVLSCQTQHEMRKEIYELFKSYFFLLVF